MKRFINIIAAAAVSCFAFSSCEDLELLQERPYAVMQGTYPSTYDEVVTVINTVYYQLRNSNCFSSPAYVDPMALSDLLKGRGTFAADFENGITSACESRAEKQWNMFYKAIRYANQAINMTAIASSVTEDERNAAYAEARFLRALTYSYLVKFYGGVPLVVETDDATVNKPRESAETIWQYIKDEMTYAAGILPDSPREYGRPGKAAAYFGLAEANLYLENWSEAEAAAKKAIDLGVNKLVRLSEPYDWEKVYAYKSDKGSDRSEEVFYIQYNQDITSLLYNRMMDQGVKLPKTNEGVLAIYADETNKKIAAWDNNDFRYQYFLYKPTAEEYENCGNLKSETATGLVVSKYRDYDLTNTKGHHNYPIIKYTDILFEYAEAAAKAAGAPTADAMEVINQIHRRAYGQNPTSAWAQDYKLSDYSTLDKFMTLLLKEKGYETFAEGKRYFDLKRLGLLGQYAYDAGRISSPTAVKDKALWWPIPPTEIANNTAMSAEDQNPGW